MFYIWVILTGVFGGLVKEIRKRKC